MSKSRMLLAAAVATLTVMPSAVPARQPRRRARPSSPRPVKLTGKAAGGKKFNGTYTIQRFTRSGSKLFAVGT